MSSFSFEQEFDRQQARITELNIPTFAGLGNESFTDLCNPLREKLASVQLDDDPQTIPFIIVIKSALIAPEQIMPLIQVKKQHGLVNMTPLTPADFSPLPEISLPNATAYLLTNIQTGREFLNVTPAQALQSIKEQHRTPLTIDEGVSLLLQFPEILEDKERFNAFSMLASRRNDQRVPALWISYKQPRLGWCWDNNPHTWLGSASARMRIG